MDGTVEYSCHSTHRCTVQGQCLSLQQRTCNTTSTRQDCSSSSILSLAQIYFMGIFYLFVNLAFRKGSLCKAFRVRGCQSYIPDILYAEVDEWCFLLRDRLAAVWTRVIASSYRLSSWKGRVKGALNCSLCIQLRKEYNRRNIIAPLENNILSIFWIH